MANQLIREQNMGRVLAAAQELFERCGVEQTTLRQVAEGSGLSTRSVLNYFSTKEELQKAVLGRMLAQSGQDMNEHLRTEAFQGLDGCGQLLEIQRAALRFAARNARRLRCFMGLELAIFGSDEPALEVYYRRSAGNAIVRALDAALQKGLEDGSVRPDAPCGPEAAVTLSYLMTGFLRRIALTMGTDGLPESCDAGGMIESYLALISYAYQNRRPAAE